MTSRRIVGARRLSRWSADDTALSSLEDQAAGEADAPARVGQRSSRTAVRCRRDVHRRCLRSLRGDELHSRRHCWIRGRRRGRPQTPRYAGLGPFHEDGRHGARRPSSNLDPRRQHYHHAAHDRGDFRQQDDTGYPADRFLRLPVLESAGDRGGQNEASAAGRAGRR